MNGTVGCVGGLVIKRTRAGTFRGLWNTTDGTKNGKIVGIFRNGFFHGNITINNETHYRIVGFYRYNQEKNTAQLRWMTTQNQGWAALHLSSE